MELPQPPSWDELFFRHVYLISSKSKDNRTKIGAILVKNNSIIASGYNGICRKVDDSISERFVKPEKYFYFEHGERNAIYQCARVGISSEGSIMYTNYTPCHDCARAVIQAGVVEVKIHKQWGPSPGNELWRQGVARSEIMFKEAGVKLTEVDVFLGIKTIHNGEIVTV